MAVLQGAGISVKVVAGRETTHASINDNLGTANDPVTKELFTFVADVVALLNLADTVSLQGRADEAAALYREGGIRGCEIGTVMFGRGPDGAESPAGMDLVRLAIPRRTYTQSHIDYVIEIVRAVKDRAPALRGLRIVEQPPALRHFTARFAPLGPG